MLLQLANGRVCSAQRKVVLPTGLVHTVYAL